MIKIDQVIIVEGKYDKIKLNNFLDALIITTDGFRIYKNKEKINIIKKLAKKHGVIILTDSDVAGFKIRNYISNCLLSEVPKEKIINIYIPQVVGKEKRKSRSSKENLLGVEGTPEEIIIKALKSFGVLSKQEINNNKKITKLDFFEDGLIGQENSKERRDKIKKQLDLPANLSTNSLLEILNKIYLYQEYKNFLKKF